MRLVDAARLIEASDIPPAEAEFRAPPDFVRDLHAEMNDHLKTGVEGVRFAAHFRNVRTPEGGHSHVEHMYDSVNGVPVVADDSAPPLGVVRRRA